MSGRALAVVATLVAALLSASCGFGGSDGEQRTTTTTRIDVVRGLGKGDGFNPQAIYKEEAPGVVTVVSLFGGGTLQDLQNGGGGGGVGSGFVVNGDGEIATNAHVVTTGKVPDLKEARKVYVEFADGNQVEADVKGYDPDADVALLKVDPQGLTLRPLRLGRSADVAVGTPVAAIGSPFDERQSLSVGVVSAIDRSIGSLTAFQIAGAIQTDAAINPGNSGGPLVNEDGDVIGINQQIKTNSGGGEGVGFAVPVDAARRSLGKLRAEGKVAYAYLGVETVPIYPQLRARFDLPVSKGAWLQDVSDGGPAERAGLHGGGNGETTFQVRRYRTGGDVITKVGNVAVEDPDDLSRAVARLEPGSTVAVESWREGERHTIRVKLGDRPLSPPPTAG
jgi:S1-C subfamily serine protease